MSTSPSRPLDKGIMPFKNKLPIVTHEVCPECKGTKTVESYPWFAVKCPRCNGTGIGKRLT